MLIKYIFRGNFELALRLLLISWTWLGCHGSNTFVCEGGPFTRSCSYSVYHKDNTCCSSGAYASAACCSLISCSFGSRSFHYCNQITATNCCHLQYGYSFCCDVFDYNSFSHISYNSYYASSSLSSSISSSLSRRSSRDFNYRSRVLSRSMSDSIDSSLSSSNSYWMSFSKSRWFRSWDYSTSSSYMSSVSANGSRYIASVSASGSSYIAHLRDISNATTIEAYWSSVNSSRSSYESSWNSYESSWMNWMSEYEKKEKWSREHHSDLHNDDAQFSSGYVSAVGVGTFFSGCVLIIVIIFCIVLCAPSAASRMNTMIVRCRRNDPRGEAYREPQPAPAPPTYNDLINGHI